MSEASKNVMVRVIKRRLIKGETFAEIITTYPKLTEEEIEILKEAVGA